VKLAGLVFVDASVPPSDVPSRVANQSQSSKLSLEEFIEDVAFAAGLDRLIGACPGSLPGFRMHLIAPSTEGSVAKFRCHRENGLNGDRSW
jgi:hypothetical protein